MKSIFFITNSLFYTILTLVFKGIAADNILIKKVESIKDEIFKDVLSQMNITGEVISKDEYLNVYRIFKNKTHFEQHHNCDQKLNTLKLMNNTHTCYVLGSESNQVINELFKLLYNSTNSTKDIYFDRIYEYKNSFLPIQNLEKGIKNETDNELSFSNDTNFRFLANFHELNQNEVNYRRKYPRRRYMDTDYEEKLSRKERKKRKKKMKKIRKKQKKLRKKRKKKNIFEQVKSTVKWMACVEISIAICSCCLTIIQAIVLPYVSPIPIGARVQPVNSMFSRGYEDYGNYNGFPLSNAFGNTNFYMGNNNNNNNNGFLGALFRRN